jgi:hypothetical protein
LVARRNGPVANRPPVEHFADGEEERGGPPCAEPGGEDRGMQRLLCGGQAVVVERQAQQVTGGHRSFPA